MINIVSGKSMSNFLGLAFIKYIKFTGWAEYDGMIKFSIPIEIGDIVVFRGHDKKTYCHRIIAFDKTSLTTKGDNISVPMIYERNIPYNNIIGKVVWKRP